MTPADVLNNAIARVTLIGRFTCRPGRPGRPGEVVETLNAEQRQVLQRLRSDDPALQSLYGIGYPDHDTAWRQRNRNLMEEFDLKVLKIDPRTFRKKYQT